MDWLLFPIGLIAGFIDAIAGGGGLITVPSLALVLGSGVGAIGTNKLAACISVAASFFVYARAGHFRVRSGVPFAIVVGLSAMAGSFISPHLPRQIFPWLLLMTCPLVLFVVWKKDIWLKEHPPGSQPARKVWIVVAGLVIGMYDGVWGPGGGTFMFLALVFWAKLPMLESLTAAKCANLFSGFLSFVGYASQGYVNFELGLILGGGMLIGSLVGANLATKNAARVVRPALAVVSLLLMCRVFYDWFQGV